jgi:hypothetical protein
MGNSCGSCTEAQWQFYKSMLLVFTAIIILFLVSYTFSDFLAGNPRNPL